MDMPICPPQLHIGVLTAGLACLGLSRVVFHGDRTATEVAGTSVVH